MPAPGDKQELPAPHGEDGGLARALPVGAGGEGTGGRAVGGPPASADVRAHVTLNVGLAPHVLLILPVQSHFIQCGQNGCGVSGESLNCVWCLEGNEVLAILSLCPEASVTPAIGHPSFLQHQSRCVGFTGKGARGSLSC